MRYMMKQKWLSWGDDFHIMDAAGNNVFFVDGQALSFGDKLSFQDMSGNELAFIEQKVFQWSPTYQISVGGSVVAQLKKELFAFPNCRFDIETADGPLRVEGDFLDHEYAFYRGDRQVAAISKQWFALTDTYGVDVATAEDEILILACTVAIDMICHDDDD